MNLGLILNGRIRNVTRRRGHSQIRCEHRDRPCPGAEPQLGDMMRDDASLMVYGWMVLAHAWWRWFVRDSLVLIIAN